MKFTTEIDVPITPRTLAEMFCGLNDEEQAQFFVECAAIARDWQGRGMWQWFQVGRHLKNCECATDAARDLVVEIADGITSPLPQSALSSPEGR